MKPVKIASSATVTGLEAQLNKYYYSTQYTINPETLEICNTVLGPQKVEKLMIFAKQKGDRFIVYQYQKA